MTLRRAVVGTLFVLAFLLFTTVALPVFVRQAGVGAQPNPAELSRAIGGFLGGWALFGLAAWLNR